MATPSEELVTDYWSLSTVLKAFRRVKRETRTLLHPFLILKPKVENLRLDVQQRFDTTLVGLNYQRIVH